jgi:hypothetical protein
MRGIRLFFDSVREANFKLKLAKRTFVAPQVTHLKTQRQQ